MNALTSLSRTRQLLLPLRLMPRIWPDFSQRQTVASLTCSSSAICFVVNHRSSAIVALFVFAVILL
jgi:hypothetical protein